MRVTRLVWPDAERHHPAIRDAIARHRQAHPGTRLNVGGRWAGPKTLFTDPEVATQMEPLRAWLASHLDVDPDKGITAWGLIVEQGESIARHKHEKSTTFGCNRFAGTYCVSMPNPHDDASSVLTVYDGDDVRAFSPTPGAAVVFGATTFHESAPHKEAEPRVMVAFSVP